MFILWCLLSYLIGSISSAVVTAKILNLRDPRSVGSGNAGATNMLRYTSKYVAVAVLIADMLKAIIPLLLAHYMNVPNSTQGYLVLCAVVGHIYPVFFQFQGGKGVATTFGGILMLSPTSAMASLIIFGGIAKISRHVSLASISAACCLPCLIAYTEPMHIIPVSVMAIVVIIKHRDNILRLRQGTEPKLGQSK